MNDWDKDKLAASADATREYLIKAHETEGEMHAVKESILRNHRAYQRGMWTQVAIATFNVVLALVFRREFTWIDSMCMTFSACFGALMWSWGKQAQMRSFLVDLSLIEAKMFRQMGEAHLASLEAQLGEDGD